MKQKLEITENRKICQLDNGKISFAKSGRTVYNVYKLYEDSKLGIYVMKNYKDDDFGFEKARENLNISFPYTSTLNIQQNMMYNVEKLKLKDLNEILENLGSKLDFKYLENVKVNFENITKGYTLSNENNLHMNFLRTINRVLVESEDKIKFSFVYNKINTDKIAQDVNSYLKAEKEYLLTENKISISEIKSSDLIVTTENTSIYDFFEKILNWENVKKEGIINRKLFSEKLTLKTSLDPEDSSSLKYGILPFFDFSGDLNINYKIDLIKKGVVLSPFTNKKIANDLKDENIVNTACSYLQYESEDIKPSVKLLGACIKPSSKYLSELTKGAVYIKDFDLKIVKDDIYFYVRNAYLFKENEVICKIKPFRFKIDGFRLFMDHFQGVSKDFFPFGDFSKGIVFKDIEFKEY